MSLPVVKKKAVWRVGGLECAGGRPFSSMEGLGMSVSECPEAWRQIARLRGGDTWRLSPKAPRKTGVFLDVHALAPEQVVELTRVAIEEGFLRSEKRWKAMIAVMDDEEEIVPLEEDYRYSYFKDRKSAEKFARTESPDGKTWRVAQETVAAPTEKLDAIWAERFSGRLTEMIAGPIAWQVILERDRPDLDGLWWDDELDPDGLSAPRGMIFYSRIKNWGWRKSMLMENPGHNDDPSKRQNMDDRLRSLERAWRATPSDASALSAYAMAAARAGQLWPERARLDLVRGHADAILPGLDRAVRDGELYLMADLVAAAHASETWTFRQDEPRYGTYRVDPVERAALEAAQHDRLNAHVSRVRLATTSMTRLRLLAFLGDPGAVEFLRFMRTLPRVRPTGTNRMTWVFTPLPGLGPVVLKGLDPLVLVTIAVSAVRWGLDMVPDEQAREVILRSLEIETRQARACFVDGPESEACRLARVEHRSMASQFDAKERLVGAGLEVFTAAIRLHWTTTNLGGRSHGEAYGLARDVHSVVEQVVDARAGGLQSGAYRAPRFVETALAAFVPVLLADVLALVEPPVGLRT